MTRHTLVIKSSEEGVELHVVSEKAIIITIKVSEKHSAHGFIGSSGSNKVLGELILRDKTISYKIQCMYTKLRSVIDQKLKYDNQRVSVIK